MDKNWKKSNFQDITSKNMLFKSIKKMQGLYIVSGMLMHYTEWSCQAFYQVREVDSVLQLIFISKVNILQVYNKLEVSRTFYKFSGTFSLLCNC